MDCDLPYNMGSPLVNFTEDIEEEDLNIWVQGLVVQKELCKISQILTVELFLLAVYLKHADIAIPVYLISCNDIYAIVLNWFQGHKSLRIKLF